MLTLVYRSSEAWNEAGRSDESFDQNLDEALAIADAYKRRAVMEDLEKMLQDSEIIIQLYWPAMDKVVQAKWANQAYSNPH